MAAKNIVLNFDEVIEFKQAVQSKFGVDVHFHDACGAQSFSVAPDTLTPELRDYLSSYFEERKATAHIADDGNIVIMRL